MTTDPSLAIATHQPSVLDIRVLGPLQVIASGGDTVAIRGPKLRTLVAALALHAGRVISADRLISAVYGEEPPKQADNALQALISALRRTLRDAGLHSSLVSYDGTGYRLAIDRVNVDALRFADLLPAARARMQDGDLDEASQLLHAAIDSWHGHSLEALSDSDETYGERIRLEELRLNAIEDCVECDLAIGQHDRWLDDLEQIVNEHPLRERLWGQLMILQYRAGRQVDALRSYQRARRHLVDQLGVTPGPELRRIESAVLAHDPILSSPVRTSAVTRLATPAPFLRIGTSAGRPHRPGRCRSRQMRTPHRLAPPDAE